VPQDLRSNGTGAAALPASGTQHDRPERHSVGGGVFCKVAPTSSSCVANRSSPAMRSALLGGAVVGLTALEHDGHRPRTAVAAAPATLDLGGSAAPAESVVAPGASGEGDLPLGSGDVGASNPAPSDPIAFGDAPPTPADTPSAPAPPPPSPAPSTPPTIPVNPKIIQAILAPSITASVIPASRDVWHGGSKGLCLDPGSGATFLTVDAQLHVAPGRSIASVSMQYDPVYVTDITSWANAGGSLDYTVAFNGSLPGPYTLMLTLTDNTGATAHFTAPVMVHDCVNPA
jgi:hypothetical protein